MNEIQEVLNIFKHKYNKQVILYGPPGTSKTYSAKIIAASFLKGGNAILTSDESEEFLDGNAQVKLVQFHPSYNYEDFVRGIKVEIDVKNKTPNYSVVNKVFGKVADDALKELNRAKEKDRDPRNYVLIIDEINRAPVASVLGELIYGLEYRGTPISTPYDIEGEKGAEKGLIVPENLYIIGTMNTADRSIGSIDYAVRRRFAFVPVLSSLDVIKKSWDVGSISEEFKESVSVLFKNVEELFNDENLADLSITAEDIKIGHTYFLYDEDKCKDDEEASNFMKHRIKYQIIPIIEEYVKDGLIKDGLKEDIENLFL